MASKSTKIIEMIVIGSASVIVLHSILRPILARIWRPKASPTKPLSIIVYPHAQVPEVKLFLTKDQYLSQKKYFNSYGSPFNVIVIRAVILHPINRKVCLLKRTADDIYHLPSGTVDDIHTSLLNALDQEVVYNDAGLEMTRIRKELDPIFHFSADGEYSCVVLNYVVEVEDENIVPEPGWMGIWAGEEELEGLLMAGEVRKSVDGAFEWHDSSWRRMFDSVLGGSP